MLTIKPSGSMVKVTSATNVLRTVVHNQQAPGQYVVKEFFSSHCTKPELCLNEISMVKSRSWA